MNTGKRWHLLALDSGFPARLVFLPFIIYNFTSILLFQLLLPVAVLWDSLVVCVTSYLRVGYIIKNSAAGAGAQK